MKSFRKYIAEFFVIIFSVLSAFWVEEYRERLNEDREIKEAVSALYSEIIGNEEALKVNSEFFTGLADALYLYSEYGTKDGKIYIKKTAIDSILAINDKLAVKKLECIKDDNCFYIIDLNFNMIPDLPIRDNIWTSIKSSQVASKIDVNLMALASNFYNSWSYEILRELLINYNNSFIGDQGDFDAIPSLDLIYRLKTLHGISLAKYEDILPEFKEQTDNILSE